MSSCDEMAANAVARRRDSLAITMINASTAAPASSGWWVRYSMRRSIKGAHYSQRARLRLISGRRAAYNKTMRSLPLAAGLLLLVFGAAFAQDSNPAKAEAELKAVRAQIDKVKAEMERDAGRRDKLARDIEESEKSV